MRTKKVNRYYCDFCKKAGCNKYWIVRHEEHCTMNPDRKCGMCEAMDKSQPEMSDLLSILPKPEEYFETIEYGEGEFADSYSITKLNQIFDLQKLRDVAENCPICIFAALRQIKIPIPAVEGFDFKKECASMWAEINTSNEPDYSEYQ